jgi:putative component of membrane protein insertase Oxa1/YidC/SpoIIIJ protein YidD
MLACITALAVLAADPWAPWDRPAPPSLPAEAAHEGEAPGASANAPLQWLIRGYQLTLSGQDLASCPMFPTCSRFAMEAYDAYDPVQATLMTADRLIRDNPGAEGRYRVQALGDRLRLVDPPAEHVLW